MSTRKKNAEPPRHHKSIPAVPPAPAPAAIDIDAILKIGDERVYIVCEENDNIVFMADLIDTA